MALIYHANHIYPSMDGDGTKRTKGYLFNGLLDSYLIWKVFFIILLADPTDVVLS